MNCAEQNAAPSLPRALALDVGGTSLKAGLVTSDGRMLFRAETPTRPQRPPEQIERDLIGLHDRVATCGPRRFGRAGDTLGDMPLGLALPGLLSSDGQTVARADNLPTLNGYPLVARLRRRWGPGLFVGADCLLAALADRALGAGRGASRLIVATVGTGVGAAVLIDGRPIPAALLGQVAIEVPGGVASSPRRVRLETVASSAALDRAVRRAAGAELDHEAIGAAIASGAPAVRAAVRRWAAALAAGFGAWNRQYDAERIVIAGGLTAYGPSVLEAIRSACRELLPGAAPFEVEFSPLGRDAALIGAGLSALGTVGAGAASH